MKRDMELVRSILLKIEESPYEDKVIRNFGLEGQSAEKVNYHLGIMREAGLIVCMEVKSDQTGSMFWPRKLTWEGHEFLDAARNETIWKRAWDQVKSKGGTVGLDVMKQLLVVEAKQFFLNTSQ
jgi:hypothetical protein